jgi:hypothetical protein
MGCYAYLAGQILEQLIVRGRELTSDDWTEEGHERMPAERSGKEATLHPPLEEINSDDKAMSRRRMLQLSGGALAGAAIALTSGLNLATKDAQAWWNTGCKNITSYMGTDLYVVDLEDPRFELLIPANSTRSFGGVIFPWCNSLYEVRTKAFLFRLISYWGQRQFYMFQDYSTEEIYWLPASSTTFAERRWAGARRSSYVDVYVRWGAGNLAWPTARTA